MTGLANQGAAVSPANARTWLADLAWSPALGLRTDVLIEAEGDRLVRVTPDVARPPATAARLHGLTMPGLANAHSHAFHRALRGITQASRGTFWTWRERMYEVADRLDPGNYLDLATAVYAEMALAGISCVGEFHYLHHGRGGTWYADPNEMGRVLIEAADRAGIRITLLDTCYLAGGLSADGKYRPLEGPQLRFGDGDCDGWATRVDALGPAAGGGLGSAARAGAAIHSVRAVPLAQMHGVVAWSHRYGVPLHVHLSEQVAENRACLAAYRATPAEVLSQAGALGPRSTAVHATHLTGGDVDLLGGGRCHVCLCPTTEADLADGIGPARELADAGSMLTLGSDSHAVIDMLEEARRVELGERLASQKRGHFTAVELATAATAAGHASLGWADAGELAAGALADFVTVSLDTLRTAGGSEATALESVIFAATTADVASLVVGGREIVTDGRHALVPDVPGRLSAAIAAVLH
ncbi:MAG TPA: formimidoylglutamate deiminase [Streptosporangiaceae bacterium]|nr:formimidoylglutamate deiminase [Streptosporangiaceae bacterium]